MATQHRVAQAGSSRRGDMERLQDEVYRHMLRLEAGRQGAALELAVVLLSAWMASSGADGKRSLRHWLKKISPVCLPMIDAAREAHHDPASSCDSVRTH